MSTLLENNLFSQLVADKNICYSPLSLQLALQLLRYGSCGTVASELDTLLDGQAKAESNEVAKYANSAWLAQDVEIKETYLHDITTNMNAHVQKISTSAPAASAETINNWVKDQTNGKIANMVAPDMFNSLFVMCLINALYLKVTWQTAFDKALTRTVDFHTKGGLAPVEMMHQKDHHHYYQSSELEIVDLAFSNSDHYSMLFAMPTGNLSEFVNEFDPFAQTLSYGKINLALPKFKIESEIGLNSYLKNLGAKSMFNPALGDFGPMTDAQVAVSLVLQKTFIEVSEVGVEAAAATAIVMTRSVAKAIPSVCFDRPFAYYIVDKHEGRVLFCGTFIKP